MKTLPTGMQAHLDGGTTSLCRCWRVTRRDGTKLGFTDHDRDLTFDSTTFKASEGFVASATSHALGMSVDNAEINSVLSSAAITDDDIANGLYDAAFVEVFLVNWETPAQRIILLSGYLGEVTTQGIAYRAELRSLTSALNQTVGRIFQRTCDAVFGDSRCKVNKATYTYSATVVSAVNSRSIIVSGLSSLDAGWLSRGVLTWTSGANIGAKHDVKVHTKQPSPNATLELWTPCVSVPAPGDVFSVVAGCQQTLAVCRDKYNNSVNFQGFPYIPGNDVPASYPTFGDTTQDGSSRVS